MRIKNRTLLDVLGFIALTAVFFLACIDAAYATGKRYEDNSQDQRQDQHQGQEQGQHQNAHANANAEAAGGAANNEGNNLSVNSNYEGGPADLLLVPNNNTENCLRVFGFSFGNKDGSGMFGFPWRSKQCDYKGFAADADAQGNLELGWFWRCHMKSAYKVFRDKGESEEAAIGQCHEQMVGKVELLTRVHELETELLEYEENASQADVTKHAVEVCTESTTRAFEKCAEGK
jgi:hypothetical protein